MADQCKRCGTLPPYTFWCCTAADDGGPPWRTLEFYDSPLTAFRVRDGFVEVREYDHDTGAHQTVTVSAANLATIAEALAKATP